MPDSVKSFIKNEIEKLMLDLGFMPVSVKLAHKTKDGTEVINCFQYDKLYSMITFLKCPTTSGEIRDWVLIEYADSLSDAGNWVFEDGDMIPLDVPHEQIIDELKQELSRAILYAYRSV